MEVFGGFLWRFLGVFCGGFWGFFVEVFGGFRKFREFLSQSFLGLLVTCEGFCEGLWGSFEGL